MQRIAHRTSLKAADGNFALLLSVQHVLHFPALQHGESPSHSSSETLSQNPLLFTLSGSKDGILATHDELLTSKTTNHLLYYLRKNAFELGLDTISRIVMSQASIPPGFTVSFANVAAMDELFLTRPMLSSIHLDYRWKTRPISYNDRKMPLSDLYDDPFTKDLTLPLQTLLDDVIARFVKNSLVRRYPFVFGSLACQFNNEAAYFRPMVTSIERIVKRSLDPAFRSQCERLFKLLRHRFSPLSDLDHTTETHGRHASRYGLSTEAVFHFAMQRVFKAGMKSTAFKGAHGYIMDIEEHQLLETEPRETGLLPDRVPSLTPGNLILDQDEDNFVSNNQPWGALFFEMFNSLHSVVSSARSSTYLADDILLDADSEDNDDLCDLGDLVLSQEAGSGNITFDLDDSDEGELHSFPSRPAESPAASYSINIPTALALERFQECPEGTIDSSPTEACTEFYVENVDCFRLPQSNCSQGPEPAYKTSSNSTRSGHDAQQARSGDTRASQAKDNMNHMVHLTHWWTQDALITDLCATRASRASTSLELEYSTETFIKNDDFPLDMDLDTGLESDGSLDLLIETGAGIQEPRNIATKSSLDGATIRLPSQAQKHASHHDFLDVLSEDIYTEEDFNMAGLGATTMASVVHPNLDRIIDEDMITGSPNPQNPERPVLGDCFLGSVYEDSGAETEMDCVSFRPSESGQPSATGCEWGSTDEMSDLSEDEDATFLELIT